MGDDISLGSVTDCLLRLFFDQDILSSAKLHYSKNQNNKPEPMSSVISLAETANWAESGKHQFWS
jgi:hypothetical protein